MAELDPDTLALFRAHEKTARAMAWDMRGRVWAHADGADRESLEAAALVGLWKAIRTFDGVRPFHRGFWERSVRWEICNWLREAGRIHRRLFQNGIRPQWQSFGLLIPQDTDSDPALIDSRAESPEVRQQLRDLVDLAMRPLSHRDRKILRLYFWEGLTMAEIGPLFGLTKYAVQYILKAALALSRERLEWHRDTQLDGGPLL